jgi:DinB family protein
MSPELERTLREIDRATNDMSDEQLAWRFDGKWSTGDILEHLSLAFSGTIAGMRKRLESDRPTGRAPTGKERLRSFVLTRLGYFPSGRGAPAGTVPQGVPPRVALNSIRQNLVAMDRSIADCEARFGSKIKFANHPVLGPLSATEWRRFHYVHTRHHMRQVRALRQRMQISSVSKSA